MLVGAKSEAKFMVLVKAISSHLCRHAVTLSHALATPIPPNRDQEGALMKDAYSPKTRKKQVECHPDSDIGYIYELNSIY
jgi:hypothetical protein